MTTELRDGLAMLINGTDGFACRGKYGSMEEGLRRLVAELPDVVLCDIGLPGMDGIEGIKILKERFPDLLVIMLTIYDDEKGCVAQGANPGFDVTVTRTMTKVADPDVVRRQTWRTTYIAEDEVVCGPEPE